MIRRKFFKTLLGAAIAVTIPLELKSIPDERLPIVKITFPPLLAAEIVGIQPMNGPVGQVFHLTYKH